MARDYATRVTSNIKCQPLKMKCSCAKDVRLLYCKPQSQKTLCWIQKAVGMQKVSNAERNINNYICKNKKQNIHLKPYFHPIWNGLKLTDSHTSEVHICAHFLSANLSIFLKFIYMNIKHEPNESMTNMFLWEYTHSTDLTKNVQRHYRFIWNIAHHLHRFPTDMKNFPPFNQAVFKKAYVRYNTMMQKKHKWYKFLVNCAVIQITSCKTPVGVLPWTCQSEGKWPSR